MEGVVMGTVHRLVPVGARDGEDAERGLLALEDAGLEGRTLGLQNVVVVDVEGVLIVHRRVVRRVVQGGEVVAERLDLRPLLVFET